MKITKPDVFHIGIPKSGTTSIQYLLEKDKRVELTRSTFYSTRAWWENTIIENHNKVVVESNETLISGGFQKVKFIQTIERMYRTNPKAQIILVLRNQPDAILSMYKYHIKNGYYGIRTFNNWLLNTDLGMDYLSLTLYGNIVSSILAYFPSNQINILFFEELKASPKTFYKKIYKILDLNLESSTHSKKNTNTYNNNELYSLVLFHYLSLNKKKSENRFYSNLGFKIEQKIRFRALKIFRFKAKKDFFSWNQVKNFDNIYTDFQYSNQKLIDLKLSTESELIKYKYPL